MAGAHRARPRGRMRCANLLPHPNASHRPALQGMRVRHGYDVNFSTTPRSWRGVNEQGLNWKIGLILYQDVLAHRDQMIKNVEVYSQQHHEEYQEHVNSEMEFMRRSLINAYNILDEQSTALAEAHLTDEGSTQRILELERRVQLAEAGAAYIVQESVAMRGRYFSELENASQLIRQQQEMSEAMTNHFRQDGLQLREACAQYVNEKEIANKEEMELRQRLTDSSQMMADNIEMIVEHGQGAVALRDERMAEMQSTIDKLNASLLRKDDIIAAKDSATRDHFANIRDMKNMNQTKDDEHNWRNKLNLRWRLEEAS